MRCNFEILREKVKVYLFYFHLKKKKFKTDQQKGLAGPSLFAVER